MHQYNIENRFVIQDNGEDILSITDHDDYTTSIKINHPGASISLRLGENDLKKIVTRLNSRIQELATIKQNKG
jgi:hypothetical protein